MVQAFAVRNSARASGFCGIPESRSWLGNVCRARLWIFCLSPRPFPARMFLARRNPVLESIQLLRRAVPRAMEHNAALPAVVDLSDVAARVVVEFFLPAAFVV